MHWFGDGIVVVRSGGSLEVRRSRFTIEAKRRWNCVQCGYELKPPMRTIDELEAVAAAFEQH